MNKGKKSKSKIKCSSYLHKSNNRILEKRKEIKQYFEAIQHNRVELVKTYLLNGIDPNMHKGDYESGLHKAADLGYEKLVNLYLSQATTDINLRDGYGNTPLNNASKRNHIQIVEFLIKNHADVNISDINNCTPLHNAVLWKYEEIVLLLLANKADVNFPNAFGKTPLYLAIIDSPCIIIANILLHHNANINLNNGKVMPILLELILNNPNGYNCELLELLLDSGASVNITDLRTKQTALHIIAITGCTLFCQILLDYGADQTLKDFRKQTPLDVAKQQGNFDIVDMLKNYVYNFDIK